MDQREKQDDFDEIFVEDGASEPGGCLGQIAVFAILVVVIIVAALRST